jgi:hypothetical protein
MELLGVTYHVESPIGTFGDGVRVDVRSLDGLCQTYNRLGNHF